MSIPDILSDSRSLAFELKGQDEFSDYLAISVAMDVADYLAISVAMDVAKHKRCLKKVRKIVGREHYPRRKERSLPLPSSVGNYAKENYANLQTKNSIF